MKPGDKLRFRGPNGNVFVVTVGAAFSPETINRFVKSGEWTPAEETKLARRRRKADADEQVTVEQGQVDA